MKQIRIGIVGYGNLGRGVEKAAVANPDMELVAIFTRRNPATLHAASGVPMVSLSQIEQYVGKVDVMILCGGSATDLVEQTPAITKWFHTIDSFDTHANIPKHFAAVDKVAKAHNTCSIISCGWDPGLFSLNRLLMEAVLPQGSTYTFWGEGVSQGHSDAIRRVEGVAKGVQYTVPVEAAMQQARQGTNPALSTQDKHIRVCYVVPEEGADLEKIRQDIVTMPHYFADYRTQVHFISQEEFLRHHTAMPHGGTVIRTGTTGDDTLQRIEFQLKLGSNPAFTGGVLAAYARAAVRLSQEGKSGAFTVFDVPFGYLSPKSSGELMAELL